jgi:hypothetical protein
MAIELSNLTFTEQDDIVPVSGIEEILNTGIANTLAGNDRITGQSPPDSTSNTNGVYNSGTLNTDDGNDIITGIGSLGNSETQYPQAGIGIYNTIGTIETGNGNDIITGTGLIRGIQSLSGTINTGDDNDTITGAAIITPERSTGVGILMANSTLDTGKGNDVIKGTLPYGGYGYGLSNGNRSILTTGDGNDIIIGENTRGGAAISNGGLMDTGNGNDSISGTNTDYVDFLGFGLYNSKDITTGDGDDYISGMGYPYGLINNGIINTDNGADHIFGVSIPYISGISNSGIINTGNGPDFMEFWGSLDNTGNIFLGEGNDSLGANSDYSILNSNFIGTGDGNDIITTSVIYNYGVIETGNGDDSIIVSKIYNNGGAINMGDGNDSIIAFQGFESDPNSSGAWFLGEGDDYIKGEGSGDFYGGNGNDTLQLEEGTYTVGIWGEGGESPIFTKGDQLMITSEFEKLKAGSTIYDFTSLTAGQIIVVA